MRGHMVLGLQNKSKKCYSQSSTVVNFTAVFHPIWISLKPLWLVKLLDLSLSNAWVTEALRDKTWSDQAEDNYNAKFMWKEHFPKASHDYNCCFWPTFSKDRLNCPRASWGWPNDRFYWVILADSFDKLTPHYFKQKLKSNKKLRT